jgi:hypothetical protein
MPAFAGILLKIRILDEKFFLNHSIFIDSHRPK